MRFSGMMGQLDVVKTNINGDMEITGITNDTRKILPGEIFVAISGAQEDGHVYVQKAKEMGAAVIIGEKRINGLEQYVQVSDSKAALSKLAAVYFGHPAKEMKMLGVTGTKGKTTVTSIINSILPHPSGLIGTNRIKIGSLVYPSERTTPDAVTLHKLFRQMREKKCGACVMEVSSHALVQSRVAGIEYDVAVFTNLSRDHLDYHSGVEEYFGAKAILFKQSKRTVTNADDPYGKRLINSGSLTYAINAPADIKARNIELFEESVSFEAVYGNQKAGVKWNTPGQFSVYNALAAIGGVVSLGLSLEEAAGGVGKAPPVKGRMEVVQTSGEFTVIIDYAHTPDSLEKSIMTVREFTKGRIITVFGCGGDRDKGKRAMMGDIACRLSDLVIVTSDNPRTEKPMDIIKDILSGCEEGVYTLESRVDAINQALEMAKSGDTVLLCGKGHETYQEINGVKYPMDEREIIGEFWRS